MGLETGKLAPSRAVGCGMNASMTHDHPPGRASGHMGRQLALSAIMTHVLGVLVAYAVSIWVRQETLSAQWEPALLALFWGMMALGAALDALWLDEVAFDGSFRRVVLGGKDADHLRPDGDLDDLVASTRRPLVTFPLTVVAAGLLNYALLNVGSGGFATYYDVTGKYVHILRGDDHDEDARAQRRQAAVRLSANTQPQSVQALIRATSHPDPDTAAWACWALGRFASTTFANRLVEPLARAMGREDSRVQLEALIALARLQHRPIRDEVIARLTRALEAPEGPDLRLIWSLGYLQHLDALPQLTRALDASSPKVRQMAAWSLAQLRDQRGGREAVGTLERRLLDAPIQPACTIIHALSILADERSNLVLMEAFDARPPEDRATLCEPLQISSSPDGREDTRILVRPESLAMMTLTAMGRARATGPTMRAIVEPWLAAVIDDDANSVATRQAAENLLNGIREGRDDLSRPQGGPPP